MAKNVNTATAPKIDTRPELQYMGIRIQTPFSGMFKQIDLIRKELLLWFKETGTEALHPPMLRYHCIDMKGAMDMEYCIPVATVLEGNGRVKAATMPAGKYISLIYTGGGLQGNKTLIEYIKREGIPIDRWQNEKGDVFAARYEAYLTDPKVEHRKTKWQIELAIKLK